MALPKACPALAAAVPDDDTVAQLHQRIAELTEAVAARDTFIAVAAHELRNPMTPIMGQVDLLMAAVKAGRCPPEQVEQRLERVQQSVRHYLKRAAVLLDVSRINSGKLQLEPETVRSGRAVAGGCRRFRRRSPAGGRLDPVSTCPKACLAPGTGLRWSRSSTTWFPTPSNTAAAPRSSFPPSGMGTMSASGCATTASGIPAATANGFSSVSSGRSAKANGAAASASASGSFASWWRRWGATITVDDAPGGGALFTVTLPMHTRSRRFERSDDRPSTACRPASPVWTPSWAAASSRVGSTSSRARPARARRRSPTRSASTTSPQAAGRCT